MKTLHQRRLELQETFNEVSAQLMNFDRQAVAKVHGEEYALNEIRRLHEEANSILDEMYSIKLPFKVRESRVFSDSALSVIINETDEQGEFVLGQNDGLVYVLFIDMNEIIAKVPHELLSTPDEFAREVEKNIVEEVYKACPDIEWDKDISSVDWSKWWPFKTDKP